MNNLFLNRYPYTDFHELNLSWLIQVITEVQKTLEDFVAINALKYADPIQWNITTQYEKNTIVIDPVSGVAYISVQPVPSGVALTNTDYWTVVFDLGQFVVRASKNFSVHYEVDTTTSATFASTAGDWLVWGDTLYKALVNITPGDTYVVNGNIQHFTMEELVGHLDDLTTTDKTSIVNAINDLVSTIGSLDSKVGDLDDLTTTDKTSIVNAINEVITIIGDLNTLKTIDKSSIVKSINEIYDLHTNLNIKNVRDYGAVGDGVSIDTTAFQTWLDDLTENDLGFIPAGTYIISSPLTAPNIDNLSIVGTSNSKIVANFASGDILTFGGATRKRNLYINGLNIDASVSRSSGSAIKIIGYTATSTIKNIKIGDYGSGTTNLYDGIVFEFTHVTYLQNFEIGVKHDGLKVYGDPNGVYTNSSDLFVNNGFIIDCEVGVHLAGGFGGLYLDNLLIFGGKAGYRQNNTDSVLANREIFFSNTVCIDGCDNQLIDINESGNGSFININAFLSGAGYYADPGDQPYSCNVRIASAPYATIILANATNKASTQFGVYLNENTARVIVDSSYVIRDCVVGFNNVGNSAYVYCEGIFINNSNTDFYGSYAPAIKPYPQPPTYNNGDVRYNGGNIEHYNGSWVKLSGDCRVNIGNGQLSFWTGSTWQSITSANLAPRAGDTRYDIGTSAMQYYDGANWQNV